MLCIRAHCPLLVAPRNVDDTEMFVAFVRIRFDYKCDIFKNALRRPCFAQYLFLFRLKVNVSVSVVAVSIVVVTEMANSIDA